MVDSIYFLKPAWCQIHLFGLRPEQGLEPVPNATALQAVIFTQFEIGVVRATLKVTSSIADRPS
jgi:hypothetical protein